MHTLRRNRHPSEPRIPREEEGGKRRIEGQWTYRVSRIKWSLFYARAAPLG